MEEAALVTDDFHPPSWAAKLHRIAELEADVDQLRQQLNDEQQRSAHRYQELKRARLEWEKCHERAKQAEAERDDLKDALDTLKGQYAVLYDLLRGLPRCGTCRYWEKGCCEAVEQHYVKTRASDGKDCGMYQPKAAEDQA
jgi:hypothetical protein